jgi:hypothetical protein
MEAAAQGAEKATVGLPRPPAGAHCTLSNATDLLRLLLFASFSLAPNVFALSANRD